MKKIIITTNNIGLVFKKGGLVKVLPAGTYWLGFGELVDVYNMAAPFPASVDVDVLLQSPDFATAVTIVEVADNELVLVYEGSNFRKVLTAGKTVFWNGLKQYRFVKVDISDYEISGDIDRNLLSKQPVAMFVRAYAVEPHEQALLLVDGKLVNVLQAGKYLWWNNSTIIQVVKTDMRQLTVDLTGQEILTKDKAQLRINFTFQYKVTEIVTALLKSKEYDKQLYIVMQLALRDLVGRMSFDELMEGKGALIDDLLAATREKALALGVELISCGIKDIILPGDVREIMNQVLIAEKRAQANIITRREETASTRSLLNTAKLMEDNAMLYKLKEMEYVEKIAEKINTISVSGGGQIVDQLKQIFVK